MYSQKHASNSLCLFACLKTDKVTASSAFQSWKVSSSGCFTNTEENAFYLANAHKAPLIVFGQPNICKDSIQHTGLRQKASLGPRVNCMLCALSRKGLESDGNGHPAAGQAKLQSASHTWAHSGRTHLLSLPRSTALPSPEGHTAQPMHWPLCDLWVLLKLWKNGKWGLSTTEHWNALT